MKEERKRVLDMLAEGKISSDEAARLLDSLEEKSGHSEAETTQNNEGRFLKIHVEDPKDNSKVDVRLPLVLVRAASRFASRNAKANVNGADIDLNELFDAIDKGTKGEVIAITGDNGETVVIGIE